MVGLGRDELRKGERARLRLPHRERRVVAPDSLVVELRDARDLHEPARGEVRTDLAHERAEAKPRLRRRADADAGVEDHEPRDAIRVRHREAQPDRPAPVVDDDRQLSEVEAEGKPLDRASVHVVRVGGLVDRLVRAAEPEEIRHDDPPGGREDRDQAPVEKAPRRLAVEQQDRVPGALLDVVHPQPVLLGVARGVRPAGEALEALVRRAVRVHRPTLRRGAPRVIESARSR